MSSVISHPVKVRNARAFLPLECFSKRGQRRPSNHGIELLRLCRVVSCRSEERGCDVSRLDTDLALHGEQAVFGRVPQVPALPDAGLDPRQDALMLEAPPLYALDRYGKMKVRCPKPEVTFVVGPIRHRQREDVLVLHRGVINTP